MYFTATVAEILHKHQR